MEVGSVSNLACILPPALVKDSDALDLLKEFQQRSFHAFIFCAQDVDIQYILHMFCVIICGSGQQPRNLDSGCWPPKFTRRALPSVGVQAPVPNSLFTNTKYISVKMKNILPNGENTNQSVEIFTSSVARGHIIYQTSYDLID